MQFSEIQVIINILERYVGFFSEAERQWIAGFLQRFEEMKAEQLKKQKPEATETPTP